MFLLTLGPFGVLAQPSLADTAIPPMVVVSGTTGVDTTGQVWAYLTLSENQSGLLTGRRLVVYAKAGLPDAPGTFTRRGVVSATSDPKVVEVLLHRAALLGDDLAQLNQQLVGLHRLTLNRYDSRTATTSEPPSMTLSDRLAALLHRAQTDMALGQMIDLLGVTHPSVRQTRGTAWLGPLDSPLGSPATFEVREEDGGGLAPAVIGRVTLRAGQMDPLPAPTPLVIVPDETVTGDLTVKLRWASPPELRRAGSQNAGVVLWRVSKNFAATLGFPPSLPTSTLLTTLAKSNPDQVKRVAGPVSPRKLFDAANVGDFTADATTYFFADDNQRYEAGGESLADGSEYYYFAAALDSLGRPGIVTASPLAMLCRRLPPPVPSHVIVANAWTKPTGQQLVVSWDRPSASETISASRYEVFRGFDLGAHAAAQRGDLDLSALPAALVRTGAIQRVGVVEDADGPVGGTLRWADGTLDPGPSNTGKTWWYSVRAVRVAPNACSAVASSLSPPAFGTLQAQRGPEAPPPESIGKAVARECLRVACSTAAAASAVVSPEPLDATSFHFQVNCSRRGRGLSEARFRVTVASTGEEIVPETGVVFPTDEETVVLEFERPRSKSAEILDVQCRAQAITGAFSRWAHSRGGAVDPAGNHLVLHEFVAGAISEAERQALPADPLWSTLSAPVVGECAENEHLAYALDSGRIFHPQLRITLTPGTEQYRIYRRIDDGPLTLINQGKAAYLGPGTSIVRSDDASPPSNGRVGYFVQLLDESGNASPMRQLGNYRFTGDKPPTPMLAQPQAADMTGSLEAPGVHLSWFCPSEHVDRFEVFVHTKQIKPAGAAPELTSHALSLASAGSVRVFKLSDRQEKLDQSIVRVERSFLTGRVGGELGQGPRFSLSLDVRSELAYTIWLRALGPNGEVGDFSQSVKFKWVATPGLPAGIAWPARPLPAVGAFHSGIIAVDLGDLPDQRVLWTFIGNTPVFSLNRDETPVGIRVGAIPLQGGENFFFGSRHVAFGAGPNSASFGLHDPNTQVYPNAAAPKENLLPCVLYRQQVTNELFAAVSGDLVQCSPLIRRIAWAHPDNVATAAELVDPFFRWVGAGPNDFPRVLELYLVDTQPVVTGARYRYWLTRFDPTGEPIQTIPCGEVTIRAEK